MRNFLRLWTATCTAALLSINVAVAQPPRDGDRGDRGDRGGDRDRGDRGDRGGFGGPPGGFGGGPPGGFGGGPPGGFGGGPPGGFSGGRGGFDPSSFLDRLDRNGNGMLDTDEMEGPAQFMIQRMQRDDPSIRTDRPIPMSKLKEGFDKMRSGRESSDRGDDRDRGREEDSRRAADEKVEDAMLAAPLVPGFGAPEDEVVLEPVLGFGPSAELMSVEVTPKDTQDAEEILRRYDRNRDGAISGDELSSRWAGNPLDFDRNGDKKLSLNELAIRAARRRVVESSPEVRAMRGGDDRQRQDRGQNAPKAVDVSDLYKGRKSFLTTAPKLPDGLPGWFATRDKNGDQQVEMSEYSDTWSSAIVDEFNRFDMNGDGVITAKECIAAVEAGASASAATASSTASAPGVGSSASSSPTAMATAAPSTAPASGSAAAPSRLPVVADEKLMGYAQKIISKYDKNGDGALTASEWKEMLMDISPADADKDGRITIPEYAAWMAMRSKR